MSLSKNRVMQSNDLSGKQQQSYNRFFSVAFSNVDIENIIEEGGAESQQKFEEVSKKYIKDQGYYDAMFQNKAVADKTFKGRDGKLRRSKFQAEHGNLAEAVYSEYIQKLKNEKVQFIEIKRKGRSRTFYYIKKAVAKGYDIDYKGKTYKAGQFLPKEFKAIK